VLPRPYYISNAGQSPCKLYVLTLYLRRFTRIWLPPWIHALNSLGMERAIWLLPLSIVGIVGRDGELVGVELPVD